MIVREHDATPRIVGFSLISDFMFAGRALYEASPSPRTISRVVDVRMLGKAESDCGCHRATGTD